MDTTGRARDGRASGGAPVRSLPRRVLRQVVAPAVLVLGSPAAVLAVALGAFLLLPLPVAVPEARPTVRSQITHIYDAAGNEIGTFRIFEQSVPVRPEDIPEVLKWATIAAEDRSFYEHRGIDLRGMARALWADVRRRDVVQGGSTITQQLVKNLYTGADRSISRKIREAILARQLERNLSKDEILFRYLDTVYFGEGAYGVGAAAETYFGKHVSELDLSEAALLAGVLPAPSRYNPRANPELAESRRRLVLDAMLAEGFISAEAHAEAVARPVWLAAAGPPPGPATVVLGPQRTETRYPYFVDYVRRWLLTQPGFDEELLDRGGLHIYTTLDTAMQDAAEAAVRAMLEGTEPPLEMALAAVEPASGYVKALVGGRDFSVSQVNLALGRMGGGSGRQTGSAFKPFVLAAAFEAGIPPSRTYSGAPHRVGDKVHENYGGAVYGNLTLTQATRRSVNTVFTRLILDIGPATVVDLAQRMGLQVRDYDPAFDGAGSALALGVLETSPLEMASAFGVFAARGVRHPPTPVFQVYDGAGNLLLDRSEPPAERVLPEAVADNVTEVLRGVLGPGGTAADNGIGRPAAGKTGTAQENRDAWFVGYTPTLSAAVWMGYADRPRPLVGIKGVRAVTGGSLPAQVWEDFMRAALADEPPVDFSEPAPIRSIADQRRRELQGGFEVGRRWRPTSVDDGGFRRTPEAPEAPPPTTTTTTTTPGSTTTTTTAPPGGPPVTLPDDGPGGRGPPGDRGT